jgi:hypothetical protein
MSFLDTIKGFAPGIATALGGPLAGAAVSAIANKLGVEDTLEAVTEAVQNPVNREKLIELENDKFKDILKDKQSARDSFVAIATSASAPMINKLTNTILSLAVVGAWIGIQYTMLDITIPPEMRELVARVLGTLDGALMLVLSFHFGASSKD